MMFTAVPARTKPSRCNLYLARDQKTLVGTLETNPIVLLYLYVLIILCCYLLMACLKS